MIDCHISFPNPLTHLLHIQIKFGVSSQSTVDFILPAWRPGRYELAPFVENIQKFHPQDESGKLLNWEKTRPNIWSVDCDDADEITINYQYYANKMDAGNSVLDDRQIYINFINCIFYTKAHNNEPINLSLEIPQDYSVSCSLESTSLGQLKANDYLQLVDSPLLASPDLKILRYAVEDHNFSIAILGDCPFSDEKIIEDFKSFTESQINTMGGFPTKQYDFIVQSLDYAHYHGVEHQNSTILVLGPNDEANKDAYYEKLMGVASHELFHTWNVTRIRPKEMSPYQFDKETMTKTGFVTEGFTTYYGDLFLKQSGVFNQQEYFKELNTLFDRHFENYGRHESTLIQSSQNLWVDGYKNLFPSKKVSIYVKGALCSLILDLTIRNKTNNDATLIDVVKRLYEKHTYPQGGYTQEQVYEILESVGGKTIEPLLHTLYETSESLDTYLAETLSYVGCELKSKLHANEITSKIGIKWQDNIITEIAPGSPTEKYLSVGDKILEFNGSNFQKDEISVVEQNQLKIKRGPKTYDILVPIAPSTYYNSYKIEVQESASPEQLKNLSLWLGNNQK
ncbi:M61 family metallopeptidase [Reichenbachiella sp.]|uniref:M61 family metallopeptidase n=1 Tax=Reichenbachiella sp. TaxID=2184521 RepID=UPI003B59725D